MNYLSDIYADSQRLAGQIPDHRSFSKEDQHIEKFLHWFKSLTYLFEVTVRYCIRA